MAPISHLPLITQAVAYGTCFLSMWYTAKKSLWGPAWGVLSCFPWCLMAFQSGVLSMIGFELVMAALEVRLLVTWIRDRLDTA